MNDVCDRFLYTWLILFTRICLMQMKEVREVVGRFLLYGLLIIEHRPMKRVLSFVCFFYFHNKLK